MDKPKDNTDKLIEEIRRRKKIKDKEEHDKFLKDIEKQGIKHDKNFPQIKEQYEKFNPDISEEEILEKEFTEGTRGNKNTL